MTDIEKQILENQEIMTLALSQLMLHSMDSRDHNDITIRNRLIDNYHKTRMVLGKDYIKRW